MLHGYVTMVVQELLERCEVILDYKFRDRKLLDAALTHASIAETRLLSNERLEFLGDAVLGLVVCQRLFESYPSHLEGEMTKLKSAVVSRRTCAAVANAIGLTELMRVGRGLEGQGGARPSSLAAGAFEAVVAAIYLDGGLEAARTFILKHMENWIAQYAASTHQQNYKSMLQQYVQRTFNTMPFYEVLDEVGPDHSKSFHVRVNINANRYEATWGANKKDAEQKAAFAALRELGVVDELGQDLGMKVSKDKESKSAG